MSGKKALIIGNNNYNVNPLINCVNDANALAKELTECKFEVFLKLDLMSTNMYDCVKEFIKSIQPNDFIIFFYAGHGVQWGDQNFLLPCDNQLITDGDDMIKFAINAQWMVDKIAKQNPYVVIFLLDCCREYWLPSEGRGGSQVARGLHQMKAPAGTMIAFACAAGQIAADSGSDSKNGLFTKHLLKHIKSPGTDIDIILRRVAKDVANETKNGQEPFRVSSIRDENVYIVPSGKYLNTYIGQV